MRDFAVLVDCYVRCVQYTQLRYLYWISKYQQIIYPRTTPVLVSTVLSRNNSRFNTWRVANPSVQGNQRAKGHLTLAAFYLVRHQDCVSRVIAAPDITLDSIKKVRKLRGFESTYMAPTGDPPTINAKDWLKTMETIKEYLRSFLGKRSSCVCGTQEQ